MSRSLGVSLGDQDGGHEADPKDANDNGNDSSYSRGSDNGSNSLDHFVVGGQKKNSDKDDTECLQSLPRDVVDAHGIPLSLKRLWRNTRKSDNIYDNDYETGSEDDDSGYDCESESGVDCYPVEPLRDLCVHRRKRLCQRS